MLLFFKKKIEILLFIFRVKSLQKEQNSTNLLLWPPICRNKPAITPKWFNSLDTNSTFQSKISKKFWSKITFYVSNELATNFWSNISFYTSNVILKKVIKEILVKIESFALSFYRSQNILGWSKLFVPYQKLNYILRLSQTFCPRPRDTLPLVNSVLYSIC